MQKTTQKWLFDVWIIVPIIILLSFSFLQLKSVVPEEIPYQFLYIGISFLTFIIVSSLDYRIFGSLTKALYIVSLILLVTTLIFGQVTRGSIRWIEIGSLTIQPSEIIKPLIILSLAHWASRWKLNQAKAILLYIIALVVPLVLVFKQPDLGSALVIGALGLFIAVAGGMSLKFLGILFFFITISFPVFFQFLKPYQQERLHSFINPYSDPLGSGYAMIQSVIAVGSGQVFGRGLGHGTQSQLRFLPERHSDFIFASLAEELGLVGSLAVLGCYLLLLLRLLIIAKGASDSFGSLVVLGVFGMIFFQVMENVGMNLGLLPVTGITLPLVSSGGSSLLATIISLGLVQSVARRPKTTQTIEIQ